MDPAELLEQVLHDRGLSQTDLARMLDVSLGNVSDVLNGRADLSRMEWGNWFGALGLRLTYGLEEGGSGYYIGPDVIWPRLLKRLARSRKPAPSRSKGEFLQLLHEAGVESPDSWRQLLPVHLAPVLSSGWLWREGPADRQQLAAQVRALREG